MDKICLVVIATLVIDIGLHIVRLHDNYGYCTARYNILG